ncbi:hypothetical protein VM1G_05543 [Cytospora mali]|uniref:Phospholipase/carboxylesterase/thioesterase domain-containing protein n=1 Tax=Cytospora mali TaxID=578113 RepID=A0A194W0G1_CYTMA|nr:hypothetical protein VM1G_05543 [Valsa mali]
MLDSVIVNPPPGQPHFYTMILLHDNNDNGIDFSEALFRTWATNRNGHDPHTNIRGLLPGFRFVFPTAPLSVVGNPWQTTWFQQLIDDSGRPRATQPSLEDNIDDLLLLIRAESRIVPRGQIFLGGFGQGCAMAIATFFADGEGDFGGLIGLNG